jgi:methionyl-tRNA synthetase
MVHRYRDGVVPGRGAVPGRSVVPGGGVVSGRGVVSGGGEGRAGDPGAGRLLAACERAPGLVDAALDEFDFRAAADAAWDIVDQANRYIEDVRPWHLARAQPCDPAAAQLDAALAVLIHACRCLARELAPFVPATAAKVAAHCAPSGSSGRLPAPEPVFPRLDAA